MHAERAAFLWVDLSILALLVATAVVIVRQRSLFAVVMLTGIYSFLGASWMLILDAPDVAFTEAAVGAGISTVLFVGTLALTRHRSKRRAHSDVLPLAAVVLTGAFLAYGTADMPHFGDPDAPSQGHVAQWYVDNSEADIGVPNLVTGILASYRGFDTLGETTVIFAAGLAVILLLRGLHGTQRVGPGSIRGLSQKSVLRVVAKLIIPYIVLFALYVQFHGDYGPGGGFQAGVILAAGLILYGMVFGLGPLQRVVPPALLEAGAAAGVLIYAGVGIATMLLGGNYLDYNVLDPHDPRHGQHLGILLVELGVGVTVTSVMASIYYNFAGRGQRR